VVRRLSRGRRRLGRQIRCSQVGVCKDMGRKLRPGQLPVRYTRLSAPRYAPSLNNRSIALRIPIVLPKNSPTAPRRPSNRFSSSRVMSSARSCTSLSVRETSRASSDSKMLAREVRSDSRALRVVRSCEDDRWKRWAISNEDLNKRDLSG
jgi:hypothetical protein